MAEKSSSKSSGPSRLSSWLCTFVGGALCGIGAVIWGQVALVRYARAQVDRLNFLERFFGGMTFFWRDVDEQLALALREIPEDYLAWSEQAAMVFGVLGGIAVFVTLVRRILG